MKRLGGLLLALTLLLGVNVDLLAAAPNGAAANATGVTVDSICASVNAGNAAEARGWLNLAYDSLDSDLFEEAESYLMEVPPGGPLEEEIVYALVEVFYHRKKFKEGVELVNGGRGHVLPEREALLEDLYEAWSRSYAEKENFRAAKELVDEGAASLWGNEYLSALSRAYAYREEIREAAAHRSDAKLKGGGKLAFSKLGEAGKKDGWLRVCPPDNDVFRTASITCDDWLPLTAAELEKEGLALWLSVELEELNSALVFEAERLSMTVIPEDWGSVMLKGKGVSTRLDVAGLRTRCAVEGLGIRAAALLAAHQAKGELDGIAQLRGWIDENRGELIVSPYANGITLKHPGTERTFQLGYLGWLDLFSLYPEDWSGFWIELNRELGRKVRPYRCFCGREVFVRESYLPNSGVPTKAQTAGQLPGGGLSGAMLMPDDLSAGEAARWGVVAYCPKHRMLLDDEKLAEWGVSRDEVVEKCRIQAAQTPWELLFRKLRIGEGDVFFLTGGGATALSRNADVLLGIVEQFQGRPMAGETIKVWAPADEVLVVGGVETPDGALGVETDKFLRMLNLPHAAPGRYSGFEKTIRLPQKTRGTVRLEAME